MKKLQPSVAKRPSLLPTSIAHSVYLDFQPVSLQACKLILLHDRYTMTPERSRALWRMSERVFARACDALEHLHDSLRMRERKNSKLLVSRGALPTSVQAAYEEQKQQYDTRPGQNPL